MTTMTIFKHALVQSNRFELFAPKFYGNVNTLEKPLTTVKFHVSTDTNSIFLLVTNKETNLTVLDFEIPFEVIKQSSTFGDQTLWAIKDTLLKIMSAPENNVPVERYVLTQEDIINVAAATYVSKDPYVFRENYNSYYSPIRIFVPSKNSTIDDLTIIFLKEKPYTIGMSVTSSEHEPVSETTLESWKPLIATIAVTGPTTVNPDEVVELNITCSDISVTEIFVEPILGSVNKTRVFLDNGQGTLKANTFGLSSGDEVNIKFGYKYFTGISRYTKTVS
jgi:hypothetical protein